MSVFSKIGNWFSGLFGSSPEADPKTASQVTKGEVAAGLVGKTIAELQDAGLAKREVDHE